MNAILISIFLTFGWQFLGRNWETEATFEGERTNLYGKEGPISSLPPSITCASTDATDNWLLASAGMTIPLHAVGDVGDQRGQVIVTRSMGCCIDADSKSIAAETYS